VPHHSSVANNVHKLHDTNGLYGKQTAIKKYCQSLKLDVFSDEDGFKSLMQNKTLTISLGRHELFY